MWESTEANPRLTREPYQPAYRVPQDPREGYPLHHFSVVIR